MVYRLLHYGHHDLRLLKRAGAQKSPRAGGRAGKNRTEHVSFRPKNQVSYPAIAR